MITINQLKQLRDETGFSISECKKALEKARGNIVMAKEILEEQSKNSSVSPGKETSQGIIDSYIHPNKKIGVLLELRCQSDFVARSEEFKKLAHELCLQIAAMRPLFLKEGDIPAELLNGEAAGKPEKLVAEIALLSQSWIKDETKTINDVLCEYIAKFGENIVIKRFIRYEI